MFISAEELSDKQTLDTDLLIIGAGPAGLLLASEFVDSGITTTVIESGTHEFARDVQLLNGGLSLGAPNYNPVHSRFRVYGGSTTRWAGQCVPLEPVDFEVREGIPHSGWPFSRADLDPWYDRASSVLGCNPLGYDVGAWERQTGSPLPIAGQEIAASVISFAHPIDVGAALRDGLAKARNVKILLGATVAEIETTEDTKVATGVRFATLSRKTGLCRARRIVVAAGGIENARLLLASNSVAQRGIGNAHDVVGRYFLDHAYLMPGWLEPSARGADQGWHVIETFDDAAKNPGAHGVYTLDPAIRRQNSLPGCVGYFVRRQAWQLGRNYSSVGGKALVHFAEVARGDIVRADDVWQRARDLTVSAPSAIGTVLGWAFSGLVSQPRAGLRICLETTPNPESRLVLGDARDALGQRTPEINWVINEVDWIALDRFRESFSQAISRDGLGRLHYDTSVGRDGYPVSMTGGRHHMGTTRMHTDPRQGVVDADLKVHGMENLYIAGSSVFPTGGWANPTLTVAALSLRLSHHLRTSC